MLVRTQDLQQDGPFFNSEVFTASPSFSDQDVNYVAYDHLHSGEGAALAAERFMADEEFFEQADKISLLDDPRDGRTPVYRLPVEIFARRIAHKEKQARLQRRSLSRL